MGSVLVLSHICYLPSNGIHKCSHPYAAWKLEDSFTERHPYWYSCHASTFFDVGGILQPAVRLWSEPHDPPVLDIDDNIFHLISNFFK